MKKKIILFILIIFLTGCIKNEDFQKTCKYNKNSAHINDKTEINVTYDSDDKIKTAVITQNYQALDKEGEKILENIKTASETYIKKYNDIDIKITMPINKDNEYELKYYLDVQKLDNETLSQFKLKKNSIRFFTKMRENNIECEG